MKLMITILSVLSITLLIAGYGLGQLEKIEVVFSIVFVLIIGLVTFAMWQKH